MDYAVMVRLLDQIAALQQEVAQLRESQRAKPPYESESINEISAALAKAQGEYVKITHNRDNPFFKSAYADLHTVLESARAALCKHGLSFTQDTRFNDDGVVVLHSRIRHSSGQWIESRCKIIPPKHDPQSYGSTLTYHKRYSAMALLGITTSNDPLDDDAEMAMVEARTKDIKGSKLNTKYHPDPQVNTPINQHQLEELDYELAEYPDIAEQVLEKLNLRSLSEMPESKYRSAISRIRQIKDSRNGKQ